MLLFYSEEWSWWFARTTGRLDLTQADAAKSQVHKHTVTLQTLLGHWKQWKVASLYYHSANLCIPARTVPDKENWRHGGWQMAITDPLRGSLRQQVQQWDHETRTPWFCYWDNDNLSSIVIFQKKQLELPQNWQSWHDCVELSSSIPKPTKFEHWLTEARAHSPAVSQVGFSW